MNPKISVIVPVFNTSKYLVRCLNSIINQTFQDIEILVFDDCSTDNSLEIILSFSEKYNNVHFIKNSQNIGLGATRNRGIKRANGKYILFVDSDDWIDQKTCEILYNAAEENQSEILIGKYIKVYSDEIITKPSTENMEIRIDYGKVFLQENEFFTAVWNKFWLRNFVIENNLKNEEDRYFEDIPMVIEGTLAAQKIMEINFTFYYYFQGNKSSITKTKVTDKHLKDRIWVISYLRKKKNKFSEKDEAKSMDLLLAKQIYPALGNIRKYKGTNNRLIEELYNQICFILSSTDNSIFKIKEMPLYKKIIAYISPKFYIRLFTYFDKLKSNIILKLN